MKTIKKCIIYFISIILVISNSGCSINRPSKKVIDKTGAFSQQLLNQVSKNIEREMENIQTLCMEISLSKEVQDNLVNSKNDDYKKEALKLKIDEFLVTKLIISPNINAVQIISSQGSVIGSYGVTESPLSDRTKDIIEDDTFKNGKITWKLTGSDDVKSLLCGKTIRDITSGEMIGFIFIEVTNSFLRSIYSSVTLGINSDVFIIDSKGTIISSANEEMKVGSELKDKPLISKMLSSQGENANYFETDIDGKETLIVFSHIQNEDWYIVGSIPVKNID